VGIYLSVRNTSEKSLTIPHPLVRKDEESREQLRRRKMSLRPIMLAGGVMAYQDDDR
jgi:hypothetical protein